MNKNNELIIKIFKERFNELLEFKSNFYKIIVKKLYDESNYNLRVKIIFNNPEYNLILLNDFLIFIHQKSFIIDINNEIYINNIFDEYKKLLKNHINYNINNNFYIRQCEIILELIENKKNNN
jgi:hypothetical protein